MIGVEPWKTITDGSVLFFRTGFADRFACYWSRASKASTAIVGVRSVVPYIDVSRKTRLVEHTYEKDG